MTSGEAPLPPAASCDSRTASIARTTRPEQRRFGDVEGWLSRWHRLRESISDHAILGAALHSVRAVPREAIQHVARELPADVPLHIHLSEQQAENAESFGAYGLTPTRVLQEAGLLDRVTVVHATHLGEEDLRLIGIRRRLLPNDGVGPGRALLDAGASLALGSDQHAVIDPFLETRGREASRSRSRRGRVAGVSDLGVRVAQAVSGCGSRASDGGPSI